MRFHIGDRVYPRDEFYKCLSHHIMEEPFTVLDVEQIRDGECKACVGHSQSIKVVDQFGYREFWMSAYWVDESEKTYIHTASCFERIKDWGEND